MRPWVLATRNPGKLRELQALFAEYRIAVEDLTDLGVTVDPHAEEGIEAFGTFEENALAKARYFAGLLPGRLVVSDDSGLVVDALNGAPGVHSKRWCGRADLHGRALDDANNALLIDRLTDVSNRAARFVCAAAWCMDSGSGAVSGEVPGWIVDVSSGTNGFGYDAYFFVEELGCTLADATVDEKGTVSHRARAFAGLIGVLRGGGDLDVRIIGTPG